MKEQINEAQAQIQPKAPPSYFNISYILVMWSIYETRVQRIMVVLFIKTNIQSKMMNFKATGH